MATDSGGQRGRFRLNGVALSLRNRNYRLYFFGQLLSMMGTWMPAVALAFLVLKLTGSGTDLGLATAARFAPMLGLAITAAAAAPTLAVEFATMVFVGYGSITFNSTAKTMLQAAAVPTMRGRVVALWGLAWLGTTPIGGPLVGWIGQHAGARWSLVAGRWSLAACRRS